MPNALKWRLQLCAAIWLIIFGSSLFNERRSNFQQRIKDFAVLRQALESYKRDHQSYPPGAGLTAMDSDGQWNEKWIPGLVPHYLAKLPIDPRWTKEANRQYLYLSTGSGFKLVAHGAEDAIYVSTVRPDLMDPRRKSYAYGVWTPDVASF